MPNYENIESYEDWEFKKVKLKGELIDNKIFVYREKNGTPGYFVF